MKNIILVLIITIGESFSILAQTADQKYGLPELHQIKYATVLPYGYPPVGGKQKNYEESAVFLSTYSRKLRDPDLFLNLGCVSEESLESSTAGDSFSLIADLGPDLSLAEISAARAFNLKQIHNFADYSKFSRKVKVLQNHVYAVVVNQSCKRGLFVFKVIEYVPNEKVVLQYAVKSYQIDGDNQSKGFDWIKTSQ